MGGPAISAMRDKVADLWGQHKLSSGLIAERLGISRSAVMGHVSRLRALGDPRVPPAGRREGAATTRPRGGVRPRALTPADRLAELVANGATLAGAAWKLDIPLARAEQLWFGICRNLGPAGHLMASDATIRPAHGGYQDAFAAAGLLPLARELAAQVCEEGGAGVASAELVRAGRCDHSSEVQVALKALKWRFYAQPDFRAQVTR